LETQQTSSDKQVQKENDHTTEISQNQEGLENRNNQESEQLELPEQVKEVTDGPVAEQGTKELPPNKQYSLVWY
jgi:hypothetical protein